jgi:ribosomal protein S18 acetylase RimI-like enzyme
MPSIPGVTLRPIREDDLELLFRVYASTREEELAPVPWTAEQKAGFLHMQAAAQHAYYQENYRGADWLVIERDGVPAGRLYIHRREKEIRLVDISLLPEHRNAGIGSDLLRELIAESETAGKPLRIHVEKNNPALRLYERLGFVPIVDKGVYHLMERPHGAQLNTAS